MISLGFLLLAPLLVFGPGLAAGQVFYGKDTLQFYFPLTEWFVGQLKAGSIPLWLPYIFGGYPLFADGEIGMAHPLVLLGGMLFSADTAFTIVRYANFALAAVLAYWFATVLGVRPLGASLSGLVFALSSFLVGHMQHDNIVRSAVWLPALLACVELALRASGWRRLRNTLVAGLVVGMELLGVHIQPVLISLLAAAGWILVGPLGLTNQLASEQPGGLGARIARAAAERVRRCWIWAVMVGVGLLTAAVQVLPLAILSSRTMRGAGVNYFVATSYAISPPDLLTLLFPYFFRSGPEQHWSLWPPQETTLYVGILPLALALLAVLFVRRRLVLWLALGALLHLWLALGDYVSPNPYYLLWNLPGFSFLRAPARFEMVIILALGCLAGLGADWLNERARAGLGLWEKRQVRLIALSWASLLAGLLVAGGNIRTRLEGMPTEALQVIDFTYLSLRREFVQLGAPNVVAGLSASADLNNPSTRLALVWIGLTAFTLALWTMGARLRGVGRSLTVLIVAGDLLTFAGGFYPRAPAQDLHVVQPSLRELVERNDVQNVLIDPALYQLIGANQLVHFGISAAGGYSSLEPTRFMDYWWGMVRDENILLDLFNVRYVVVPRQQGGSLIFNDTRFHPAERLVHGGIGNKAGVEAFRGTGTAVDRLTVISAVDGTDGAETGQPIARVTLISNAGEQRDFGLRYGMELTGYRRGAPNPSNALWAYYGPAFVPMGRSFPVQLSGAVLSVEPPMAVDRVEVQYTAPAGALVLHGLGLHDATTFETRSVTSADRVKYRQVYQDDDVVILENRGALPKVYFREGASTAPIDTPLAEDLESVPIDLSHAIVLDAEDAAAARENTATAHAQTELLEYGASSLRATVETDTTGFVVVGDRFDSGWRAWLDGREAPVLRANSILRAVPVEAGRHVLEMRYEPWWVTLGLATSLLTLLAVATAIVLITRRTGPWDASQAAE